MAEILHGDVRDILPTLAPQTVQMCVTSPPYWGLRDYGVEGQLGLEPTPEGYAANMVDIFREVRRVLKDDGTLWLNLGDSYAGGITAPPGTDKQASNRGAVAGIDKSGHGLKPKDLIGIPWRVAFALQADGWYLRQDIIWAKPNPMPESVTDRCTKSHEYLFLLSKRQRYYFDVEAIQEKAVQDERREIFRGGAYVKGSTFDNSSGGKASVVGNIRIQPEKRNKRSVWTVNSQPFSDWQQTARWVHVEQGEVSDDNLRIVSPDCPVYGGLFDLLATVLDDAHEYDELIGILCKRGYLSLTPKDGFVPIDQIRALRIGRDSLDSFLGAYLETAIDHNSQRNRTGLFLATRLSCKTSVERLDYIERILARHELSVLRPDKPGSNTWESGFSDNQKPQTIYCIAGKSESREFCAAQGISFRLTKESISHFATFPPKLIEPCILAGSRPGDVVLDPFFGSGTTGEVCERLGRQWLGVELNAEYIEMAKRRTAQRGLSF